MTIEALLTEIRDELKLLNNKMAHIGGAVSAPATQGAPTTQEVPPAQPATPVQAPAPVQATAAPNAVKATARGKKSDAPAASAPIAYDTVKAAVQKAVAAGKRDAVVKLLATFDGAKNAQELKPEQYAQALEQLAAL